MNRNRRARFLVMGLLLGLAVGSAIGIAGDNMPVWMAVGAGAGMVFGIAIGSALDGR